MGKSVVRGKITEKRENGKKQEVSRPRGPSARRWDSLSEAEGFPSTTTIRLENNANKEKYQQHVLSGHKNGNCIITSSDCLLSMMVSTKSGVKKKYSGHKKVIIVIIIVSKV